MMQLTARLAADGISIRLEVNALIDGGRAAGINRHHQRAFVHGA